MKIAYTCAALCSSICCLAFTAVAQRNVMPETALQAYLNNGDKTYRWELNESYGIGSNKAYSLLLTSLQWYEYIWTHQLTILVPAEQEVTTKQRRSADSGNTDLRDHQWQGHHLAVKKHSDVVTAQHPYPEQRYRAFYLDLKYKDPNGGKYTKSTRMFVADSDEVFLK